MYTLLHQVPVGLLFVNLPFLGPKSVVALVADAFEFLEETHDFSYMGVSHKSTPLHFDEDLQGMKPSTAAAIVTVLDVSSSLRPLSGHY